MTVEGRYTEMIHHNPLISDKPTKKFITMGEIMLRLLRYPRPPCNTARGRA